MYTHLYLLIKMYVYTRLNDSQNNLKIYKRNLLQTIKIEICYKQNYCLSYRRHMDLY